MVTYLSLIPDPLHYNKYYFKGNSSRLQLGSIIKPWGTAGRSHCFPTEYYINSLKDVSYSKETALVCLGLNVMSLNPSDTILALQLNVAGAATGLLSLQSNTDQHSKR